MDGNVSQMFNYCTEEKLLYLPTLETNGFKQSSGLSPVGGFVTFGCSSRVPLNKLQGPSIPQSVYHYKKTVASTSHCFFCATLPHLHTPPTLRSSGLPHPPYRFIQLQSAGYLSLHLSRRLSAAPYGLGGCSFAQPSGSAPLALRPKSRYAKGGAIMFPRRVTLASLRSTALTPLRSHPAVAVRLPQPRHCAPRKSNFR